jgi:hypothetical protein
MSIEEQPDSFTTADGIWRPEEWRGRYLVTRLVRAGPQTSRREVDSTSRFSATASVYEDLEIAQARCDQLNNEEKKDENLGN